MEYRRVATHMTVIIRDDAPMIHCGDTPSYRRVTLKLTDEQQERIKVGATSSQGGRDIYEAISKVFLE